MTESTTVRLQRCLDRLQAGDATARDELLRVAAERLRTLTRKMFLDSPRLRRWEETDDVFQSALLRLWNALKDVTPGSLREFFRLAAVQVRRELIDLARRHYGPHGSAARHHSDEGRAVVERGDGGLDPAGLAEWTEFHEQAGRLPDEEREVFDLIWYQELTHDEAGGVLGVSTKWVQRRWRSAKVRLHDALGGAPPGE